MKMLQSYQRFMLLLFTVCSCVASFSQDFEEIKKKYPGENAVLLDRLVHYHIQLKNGEPYVESKESQKILYLNTNSSYLGRFSFYHSTFHELRDYAAYTQTTANKKIRVTDFQTSSSSSGSVFYDDAKETKFDFPSAVTGSTGNLELSVVHTKPYLLSPFYFSRYIPVIKTELRISFAKEIGVKYIIKGVDSSMIKFRQERKRNETTYIFSVENIPAESQYSDAPDESWYVPHVVFYIDHYESENGRTRNYLSNVDDLYKLNSSFLKDVNRVPGPELKSLVDSLTHKCKNDIDKTRNIYTWVQNHIKYIAFEDGMGGFVPRDANLVYHRRFGDCKDMAGLLTIMLNSAGIPAYFTWIGTRDLAYNYEETPLPVVDNHMICTAKLDGKYIFLDGTDPYCVFGTTPAGIQDKEALVALSPEKYTILKVPVQKGENNTLLDSTYIELNDEELKGNINILAKGYYAEQMHSFLQNMKENDREKSFKNLFSRGSNKFQLSNYSTGDLTNKNSVSVSTGFSLAGYARKIDNEWYVNMNLSKFFEHEEIDYPKRKSPVHKEFLYNKEYVTVMKIPPGYFVTYLPESKSYRNDVWGFDMSYLQKDGSVICRLKFSNDFLMINPSQFKQWNAVLEQLFPLYKESVTLSKKN